MSTAIKFDVVKLTVDQIKELNRDDTLYLVDFRATGESLTHEIRSMYIYENLSQWLCSTDSDTAEGVYVVNTPSIQRDDIDSNHLAVALPASSASVSVIDRIDHIPSGISRIWSGIAHSSIDERASALKITNNYRYSDFLRYNNKLKQKEIFGNLSPKFFEINNQADLDKALSIGVGYVKSSAGAGGFSVFNIAHQSEKVRSRADKILADETTWYYEDEATGRPQSIQIYKQGNSYTLFGHAEQYIEGTNYVGAKLFDVNDMDVKLVDFVKDLCGRIDSLLSKYEGFFGIDIMVDTSGISVLELNVRLTSTSIPTLIANNTGKHGKVEYLEEISKDEVLEGDILLAQSLDKKEVCVLRVCGVISQNVQ